MNSKEIHEYLVRLGMEAWDRTAAQFSMGDAHHRRIAFEHALRERMAQAAQTFTLELDELAEFRRVLEAESVDRLAVTEPAPAPEKVSER